MLCVLLFIVLILLLASVLNTDFTCSKILVRIKYTCIIIVSLLCTMQELGIEAK